MKRFLRTGEPFIWLTGGALCLALLMVAGLIGLILVNGLGFFWPSAVTRLTLKDGGIVTGQLVEREAIPGKVGEHRIKLKVGNRDLYGADFVWIDESQVSDRTTPPEIAVIERTEWGALIGTIREVREGGAVVLAALSALDVSGRPATVREAHRQLVGYLTNQVHRMDYPTYRAKGWQIGSGPVESACKQVVGQRLKGSGMRWGEGGADAVCHLRALFRSEASQWDAFWATAA